MLTCFSLLHKGKTGESSQIQFSVLPDTVFLGEAEIHKYCFCIAKHSRHHETYDYGICSESRSNWR
jgi:hypothetical protein